MMLRNFLPSPALREYVRFLGIVHFLFPKGTEIPPKPYSPRPETSLCFFPKDPVYITYPGSPARVKHPQATLFGQHTLLHTKHSNPDLLAVVVHFQPGVLYRLTGLPTNELTNTLVDAELLFSGEIKFVNDQLNDCRSYPAMIAVVETFLTNAIRQARKATHGVDTAARLLLQDTSRVSIDWLARETCLSTKQFERKFKERTGVNASLLARIIRFDKTVKLKNAQPDLDWLSIAVACGYHDYQHLVRDYKDFTGLTPPAYLQLDTRAPESLFGLHEESSLYGK